MRKIIAVFAGLLLSAQVLAGPPVIWGTGGTGGAAQFLTPNLNIFDRAYILTGTADPTVSAQSAPKGSLYLRTGASGGQLYVKGDDGLSTTWVAGTPSTSTVLGPASSTDNACTRFDGTTGLLLQNTSSCTISDSGVITAAGFIGPVTGNASTATALAANPADCAANTYATTIAASGDLTCSTVTDSGLATSYVKADGSRGLSADWNAGAHNITATSFIGALTGNASTATALASNPTNCSSNQFATAIAASGNLTCAQPAFTNISGSVAATQLPNPSSSTLGGIQSLAAVTSNWIRSISTSGVPAASQPAFTDISGSVAASQLPNPSSSTLGGIQSLAAVTSNWIRSISTSGVPAASQPAFTDISGSVAASQLPNPSSSTLGGVQSIASASHNFLTSISTSGVPAKAQPAFTDISGTLASTQQTAPVVQTKTTTYTRAAADDLILCSGSAFTVTLDAASTGRPVRIRKTDHSFANVITISRAGSDTINFAEVANTTTTLNTVDEEVYLVPDGSTTWNLLSRVWGSDVDTYTPTVQGTTGTVPTLKFFFNRVPSGIHIVGNIQYNGTASNVTESFTAPANALPDLTNRARTGGGASTDFPMGVASYGSAGTATQILGTIIWDSSNSKFTFRSADVWKTSGTSVPVASYAAGDTIYVDFTYTVLGWN